jgi:acyl carrier protein
MLLASRIFRRFANTTLMQGTAYAHNDQPSKEPMLVHDKNGSIVPRNCLVLRKEEEIEKYVLNLVKNYFRTANKGSLTANSLLSDHGLDALDSVELVVRIEDELGYVIPGEALLCFRSVRSLINYIKQTEDFKQEFNKEPIN